MYLNLIKHMNYTAWETGIKINSKEFLDYHLKIRRLNEDKCVNFIKDNSKIIGGFSIIEDQTVSSVVGFKVLRLLSLDILEDSNIEKVLEGVVESAKKLGSPLLIYRTSYDYPFIKGLLKVGFKIYGINLHLRRVIKESSVVNESLNKVNIKDIDKNELKNIIIHSFNCSHFHRNPIIEESKASLIFGLWVDNVKDDSIYVYSDTNGNIIGVAIIEFDKELSDYLKSPLYRLHLLVVPESYQHKGFGFKVVKTLLCELRDIQNSEVILQTGVDSLNIDAIKLYLKNGFEPFSTSIVFHYNL